MIVRLRSCWPLLFPAWVSIAGCSEELDPERAATTGVTGSVTIGGRAVTGGFIAFDPAFGTRGNLRVAPIEPDGSFHAEGVAVGQVVLRLDQLPVRSIPTVPEPIEARRFELLLHRSPIVRTILPGGATRLPIDLIEEVSRVARSPRRSRRRRGRSPRTPKGPALPVEGEIAGRVPEPDRSCPLVRVIYRDHSGQVHLEWPADRVGQAIGDEAGTVWVDIQDLESANNQSVETMLRDVFHFHPLAIEDALKDTHLPKVDDWIQYLYVVVDTIDFDPDTDDLRLHELDLSSSARTIWSPITMRQRRSSPRLRQEPSNVSPRYPAASLGAGDGYFIRSSMRLFADFLPAIVHLDDDHRRRPG